MAEQERSFMMKSVNLIDQKTTYDLEPLIIRCLNELVSSGDVVVSVKEGTTSPQRKTIINEEAVARHIALTIIGELYELEIIRKLLPAFRTLMSVAFKDFEYLENRRSGFEQLVTLKIPDPGLPKE